MAPLSPPPYLQSNVFQKVLYTSKNFNLCFKLNMMKFEPHIQNNRSCLDIFPFNFQGAISFLEAPISLTILCPSIPSVCTTSTPLIVKFYCCKLLFQFQVLSLIFQVLCSTGVPPLSTPDHVKAFSRFKIKLSANSSPFVETSICEVLPPCKISKSQEVLNHNHGCSIF